MVGASRIVVVVASAPFSRSGKQVWMSESGIMVRQSKKDLSGWKWNRDAIPEEVARLLNVWLTKVTGRNYKRVKRFFYYQFQGHTGGRCDGPAPSTGRACWDSGLLQRNDVPGANTAFHVPPRPVYNTLSGWTP